MAKQYFDLLELDSGHIWAVDEINNTKTPVDIKCLGYDDLDGKVVLQQESGGWWYSRNTFQKEEANKLMDKTLKDINELDKKKWSNN